MISERLIDFVALPHLYGRWDNARPKVLHLRDVAEKLTPS